MSVPLENLAMVESAWPGADWNHEKGTQLAGPRRGEELRVHPPAGSRNFMLRRSSSGRVRWPNSVTVRRGSVRVGHSSSPTLG